MTSVKSVSVDVFEQPAEDSLELLEDLEMEEGIDKAASMADILRFGRPEWPTAIAGLLLSLVRGFAWPIFAVINGRMFLTLSHYKEAAEGDGEDLFSAPTWQSALAYVALGLLAGITTFGSGSLLANVGEKLTLRLRLRVFQNVLRQDGTYFDSPHHSTGKLAARLARDAPNVQAAVDQRLAEVLQSLVSLAVGLVVAFYFGWNVAPICLVTAMILVLLQTSVTNYLKRKAIRDMQMAEEVARMASESIAHIRTVQVLTKQRTLYHRFSLASENPHRLSIVRGLWQALSYALMGSFVSFNFSIAYGFGLVLIRSHYTTPFTVFQWVVIGLGTPLEEKYSKRKNWDCLPVAPIRAVAPS